MQRAKFDTMHNMEVINLYLKKANKPICVGFERNTEHPTQIRFFDKDNKTVFLPDDMYRHNRRLIIQSGLLGRGRMEFQHWRSEAERQALRLRMKRKISKPINGVISAVKRLLNINQGRR